MSSYIKRRYKGKLDGCIVDELHEYNNDSGQGDAMAEIFSVADRVIGMTATLINGYSSGIFHLLYRVCSRLMIPRVTSGWPGRWGFPSGWYTLADLRWTSASR